MGDIISKNQDIMLGWFLGLLSSGLTALASYLINLFKSRPRFTIESRPMIINSKGSYWLVVELIVYNASSISQALFGPFLDINGKIIEVTAFKIQSSDRVYLELFIPGHGVNNTNNAFRELERSVFKHYNSNQFPINPHIPAKSSLNGLSLFFIGKDIQSIDYSSVKIFLRHAIAGKIFSASCQLNEKDIAILNSPLS